MTFTNGFSVNINAYTIANNAPHELIKPFSYERFLTYSQVGEKGAASVGH